jgi:hypothetical protein
MLSGPIGLGIGVKQVRYSQYDYVGMKVNQIPDIHRKRLKGLDVGDIILAIDNHMIRSHFDLDLAYSQSNGDVELVVLKPDGRIVLLDHMILIPRK